MAERPGARGIINRLRNCTMSARTLRFRIGFIAASRKAARLESKAVATRAKSHSATGSRLQPRNTDMSSPIRSGAEHLTGPGANRGFPDVAHRASRLFAYRSASTLLRWKHALANTRPRRSLEKNQPGFVATSVRFASEHRKIQGRRDQAGPTTRRDLHRRAIGARCESNLVRDR